MTKEEAIEIFEERNKQLRYEMECYGHKMPHYMMNALCMELNCNETAISALSENKDFEGMTNGEVVQALFDGLVIHNDPTKRKYTIPMTYEFWDAPYQKGGEEK